MGPLLCAVPVAVVYCPELAVTNTIMSLCIPGYHSLCITGITCYMSIYIHLTSRDGKDGKNKKWKYKGNNGGEREAGHHREEKTSMVWPCQKDARGKNSETNHGMDKDTVYCIKLRYQS